MNEIVKVEQSKIGGAVAQSVNARDLHEFLGVGKMFAHWIKDRIEKYGFAEHEDFEVIAISGKNPLGGRPEIEYHIIDVDKKKEKIKTDLQKPLTKCRMSCNSHTILQELQQ